MDNDQTELIHHLFAKASEFAEVAHESAARGQAARLGATGYTDAAEDLRQAVQGILSVTDAIVAIININCDDRPNS